MHVSLQITTVTTIIRIVKQVQLARDLPCSRPSRNTQLGLIFRNISFTTKINSSISFQQCHSAKKIISQKNVINNQNQFKLCIPTMPFCPKKSQKKLLRYELCLPSGRPGYSVPSTFAQGEKLLDFDEILRINIF